MTSSVSDLYRRLNLDPYRLGAVPRSPEVGYSDAAARRRPDLAVAGADDFGVVDELGRAWRRRHVVAEYFAHRPNAMLEVRIRVSR